MLLIRRDHYLHGRPLRVRVPQHPALQRKGLRLHISCSFRIHDNAVARATLDLLRDPLVELGEVPKGVPAEEDRVPCDQTIKTKERKCSKHCESAEKAGPSFHHVKVNKEVTPVPVVALPKGGARHGARRQSKSPALSGGRRR